MATHANGTHLDDMPPEMDYREHERTYRGFITLVKWSIISMVLMVLGLYFAVIAGNGWLGGLFLLACVVVPLGGALMARSS